MAKKKEMPKALFSLKGDFYASLDNLTHEGIMLIQALELTLKHGKITGEAANILRERVAAFRNALSPTND